MWVYQLMYTPTIGKKWNAENMQKLAWKNGTRGIFINSECNMKFMGCNRQNGLI